MCPAGVSTISQSSNLSNDVLSKAVIETIRQRLLWRKEKLATKSLQGLILMTCRSLWERRRMQRKVTPPRERQRLRGRQIEIEEKEMSEKEKHIL